MLLDLEFKFVFLFAVSTCICVIIASGDQKNPNESIDVTTKSRNVAMFCSAETFSAACHCSGLPLGVSRVKHLSPVSCSMVDDFTHKHTNCGACLEKIKA